MHCPKLLYKVCVTLSAISFPLFWEPCGHDSGVCDYYGKFNICTMERQWLRRSGNLLWLCEREKLICYFLIVCHDIIAEIGNICIK